MHVSLVTFEILEKIAVMVEQFMESWKQNGSLD